MEFSFEHSVSRQDHVASSFGHLSYRPITLFVFLDPRELCALVLFPTRNFNFVFVPRAALAPRYVNLSSISHSLSPCFFSLALTLA